VFVIEVEFHSVIFSANSLFIFDFFSFCFMVSECRLASMASHDSTSSSSSLSSASLSYFSSIAKNFSFIPTKLDSSNYLYWKAQVLATIRAFDLLSFINKANVPSKYIPSENDEPIVNPEFLNWIKSD